MNKERRARIEAVSEKLMTLRAELEELQTEEQDYFDAMPEAIQGGERGQKAEAAADALQEAADAVGEALDSLRTAVE